MNSLEEKLDYILRSNASVQVFFDKKSAEDFDKLVPEIIQAIKEEGWIPPKSQMKAQKYMTDKDWYLCFEKEAKGWFLGKKSAMEVARRASGISSEEEE